MKPVSILALLIFASISARADDQPAFNAQIEIYSTSSPKGSDEFNAKDNAASMVQNGNICLAMVAKKMAELSDRADVKELAEKAKQQADATGVKLRWRLVPGWLMSQTYSAELVLDTYRQPVYHGQYANHLGEYVSLHADVLSKASGSLNDLRDKGRCDLDADAVVAKLKAQVVENPEGLTLSNCEQSRKQAGWDNEYVREEYKQLADAGFVKNKLFVARGGSFGPTPFAACMNQRKSLNDETQGLIKEMHTATSALGVNMSGLGDLKHVYPAKGGVTVLSGSNVCLRLASDKLQEINADKEVQELLGQLKDQVGIGSGARSVNGKVELTYVQASDGIWTLTPRVGIYHTIKINPAPFQYYDVEKEYYVKDLPASSGHFVALLKGKSCVPSKEDVVKLLKTLVVDRKVKDDEISSCKLQVAGYAHYLKRLEGSNSDLGSTVFALKKAIGNRYPDVTQAFDRYEVVSARECLDRLEELRQTAEKMKSVVQALAAKKNVPADIFEPKPEEVSAKNGSAE